MALYHAGRIDLGSPRAWAIDLVDSGPSVRHRTGLHPSFLWFKGTRFPRPDRPSPIALGVVRDERPQGGVKPSAAAADIEIRRRPGLKDASLRVARERNRLMIERSKNPVRVLHVPSAPGFGRCAMPNAQRRLLPPLPSEQTQ